MNFQKRFQKLREYCHYQKDSGLKIRTHRGYFLYLIFEISFNSCLYLRTVYYNQYENFEDIDSIDGDDSDGDIV